MNDLAFLQEYWPFLVPLFLLQVGLALTAFVHVLKNPHYRFGNKPMWIVVVLVFQIIGPVIYFTLGRSED